jgi:hypothetical protein
MPQALSLTKGSHRHLSHLSTCIACLCFFASVFYPCLKASAEELPVEEISLYLNMQGLGGTEIDAVIIDAAAYLSVVQLFTYLKIKNESVDDLHVIKGFVIHTADLYSIDKEHNEIRFKDKTYALQKDDLISTPSGLYVKSNLFGEIFGLNCAFDFRTLSIDLTTTLTLPVIQEKRLEMMRQNLNKLKHELIADTTIKRASSAFNLGNADWALTATQQEGTRANAIANVRLGAVIAGGETNLSLNYATAARFNMRQQNYLWRYVNNDQTAFRQISLGKIASQSRATLLAPVIGAQITNSPTTVRTAMGSYTLSDVTQPDWTVELYINNVLIDYKKADAAGFFSFQVPMVYGSSLLQLRFYGPWGEEQFKQQEINVPYNFLPKNEFNYNASSGLVEDGKQSKYAHLEAGYGLSNTLTIGTGIEYLSSISATPVIPIFNAAYKATSDLMLSGDIMPGVKSSALINYKLPREFLFEVNYTWYKEGQRAILNSYTADKKAMISKQFRTKSFSGISRLSVNQLVYQTAKQTITDLMLSANFKGISGNLTTYALVLQDYINAYSTLAVSYRLPLQYTLRPQVQYNYNNGRVAAVKVEIEKQLFGNGALNVSYENNLIYRTNSLSLSLRFDLSFARAVVSVASANNRIRSTQSINGGMIYDKKSNYFATNTKTNNGRGALLICPYLDLNLNNKKDLNEPKVAGLEIKISGGRIENNSRDTTLMVSDLESYTNYLVELNQNSLDNIGWQLQNKTLKVTVLPNQLTAINVPIKVCGEVSGTVYVDGEHTTGLGRVTINFYNAANTLIGHAVTESDGYYNFLGLSPGTYTAVIEREQLKKLKTSAVTERKNFSIRYSINGDVVTDLDFKLK